MRPRVRTILLSAIALVSCESPAAPSAGDVIVIVTLTGSSASRSDPVGIKIVARNLASEPRTLIADCGLVREVRDSRGSIVSTGNDLACIHSSSHVLAPGESVSDSIAWPGTYSGTQTMVPPGLYAVRAGAFVQGHGHAWSKLHGVRVH